MQYHPFEDGIEVNGETIHAFAEFGKVSSDILLDVGIGRRGSDGRLDLGADEWISQALWLKGVEQIGNAIGLGALYGIGLKMPEKTTLPRWVDDIHSAIQSVDVAYHLNHRRDGKVMFDLQTGVMQEGIGHYGYAKVHRENRILCRCDTPYPCDFDKGIVTTMARRFVPDAWVEHLEAGACRTKGHAHCTYVIAWR